LHRNERTILCKGSARMVVRLYSCVAMRAYKKPT
jgi:hypothetical protein